MPPQLAVPVLHTAAAQTFPRLKERRVRVCALSFSLPVPWSSFTATQSELPPPRTIVLCYRSASLYLAGPERRTPKPLLTARALHWTASARLLHHPRLLASGAGEMAEVGESLEFQVRQAT